MDLFLLYFVVGGGEALMPVVAGKMKNLKRKNVSKVQFYIVKKFLKFRYINLVGSLKIRH